MNIYFVEAPFQLVSATAAQKKNTSRDAWLFIRKSPSERNNNQLTSLLQKNLFSAPWKKIIFINGSSTLQLVFATLKILILLGLNWKEVNKLYLGDFRSRFALILVSILKFKELCLLDDGVASLGLYTNNTKGSLCATPLDVDNSGVAVKSLVRLKNKLKSRDLSVKLVVSTFLLLPQSKDWEVEHTDLEDIFKQFRADSQVVDEALVYIVGSKVVEEGILQAPLYHAFCQQARQRFPSSRLVYIAHREESATKLSTYERDLGFEILRPELPLEFLFCQASVHPSTVVSLYSAVLFTCRLIEPKLNLVSYVLDLAQVPEKHVNTISACYSYLEAEQEIIFVSLSE